MHSGGVTFESRFDFLIRDLQNVGGTVKSYRDTHFQDFQKTYSSSQGQT